MYRVTGRFGEVTWGWWDQVRLRRIEVVALARYSLCRCSQGLFSRRFVYVVVVVKVGNGCKFAMVVDAPDRLCWQIPAIKVCVFNDAYN